MSSYRPVEQDSWPKPVRNIDAKRHVWIIDYDANEYVVIMREFRVYMLTCQPTGKRYVGVTEGHPRDRLDSHACNAFDPKRRKTLVQMAIVEYGVSAFSVETIGIANSLTDAQELEKKLIAQYGTMLKDGGLNVLSGGGRIGPKRLGYHYLELYEKEEARVIQRIPRVVNGRKSRNKQIDQNPDNLTFLRLVTSPKSVSD